MPQKIIPVDYAEIFEAPNSPTLFKEYAAECMVDDYAPQRNMYEAMSKSEILHCFGCHIADELIGFISIITSVMPHNGKKLSTIESVFVTSTQRDSGAGEALLLEAERFSKESGSVALTCSPRIGSRLEKVLMRRSGYNPTHTIFTKWL